jgi:hypothetical protein
MLMLSNMSMSLQDSSGLAEASSLLTSTPGVDHKSSVCVGNVFSIYGPTVFE